MSSGSAAPGGETKNYYRGGETLKDHESALGSVKIIYNFYKIKWKSAQQKKLFVPKTIIYVNTW